MGDGTLFRPDNGHSPAGVIVRIVGLLADAKADVLPAVPWQVMGDGRPIKVVMAHRGDIVRRWAQA